MIRHGAQKRELVCAIWYTYFASLQTAYHIFGAAYINIHH